MSVQTDPEHTEIKYLSRLMSVSGMSVLEVGCGDGRLTWQYARAAGRVAAIDLHTDDLRVARIDRPSDLETKVHLARADSVHLPFSKAAFDIAVLAWSF